MIGEVPSTKLVVGAAVGPVVKGTEKVLVTVDGLRAHQGVELMGFGREERGSRKASRGCGLREAVPVVARGLSEGGEGPNGKNEKNLEILSSSGRQRRRTGGREERAAADGGGGSRALVERAGHGVRGLARLRAVRLIPLAKSMYPEPFTRRIFSTNVFSLWLLCAWRERGAVVRVLCACRLHSDGGAWCVVDEECLPTRAGGPELVGRVARDSRCAQGPCGSRSRGALEVGCSGLPEALR